MTPEQLASFVKDAGFSVALLWVFFRLLGQEQKGNDVFSNKMLDFLTNMTKAVDSLREGVEALKTSVETSTANQEKRTGLLEKEVELASNLRIEIESLSNQIKGIKSEKVLGS